MWRLQPKPKLLLTEILAEALGLERLGVNDNLFDLGLHSLLMTRVVVRIRHAFSRAISLQVLFERPTVAQLAEVLDVEPQAPCSGMPTITAEPGDRAPLSFAQQRLWFVDRMMPGNPVFNIPIVLNLEGDLSRSALKLAFETILERHSILRTVIRTEESATMQWVQEAVPLPLREFDLRGLEESTRQKALASLRKAYLQHPFDLGNAPLFRMALVHCSEDHHQLIVVFHHIVTDTWSLGLFFREFNELYSAALAHKTPDLSPLAIQYRDFARVQRAWLDGAEGDRQMAYWREALKDIPELLELPGDYARPAIQTYRADHVRFIVPKPLIEALTKLGRKQGATLYMTLLAAWQTLLYRYSANTDICVGSSFANRDREEFQNLLGFFVNMLVMRARFENNPSFTSLLRDVAATAKGAFAHADVPFERLVDELQPERGLDRSPLFQAVFVLQSAPMDRPSPRGLSMVPEPIETGFMPYDLLLSATESDQGLACQWMYATDLFAPETANRMTRHFQILLEVIAQDPDRLVDDLALVDGSQLAARTLEWNPMPAKPPAQTLLEAFANQVAHHPDEPALEFADGAFTYAELNRQSNRLAHHLAALGVGPEVPVAIYLERSAAVITAILGILKAGGTYLPLDLGFPIERIGFMLEDTGNQILISRDGLLDDLPSFHGHVISIDDPGWITDGCDEDLAVVASPEQTAYIMYTSGSTGRPKGVRISQRAILSLIDHIGAIRFEAGRRIAQTANITFDAATFELWGALLKGGCLVGIERDILLSPERLAEAIEHRHIDTMFLTTALFHETVRQAPNSFAKLEQLIVGGEAMQPGVVRLLPEDARPAVLVNGYGPTENTTFSTTYQVDRVDKRATRLSIGRPLLGRSAYVVDKNLRSLPAGITGDLLLGGSGLASGYHDRPGLTAKTFIPDPLSGSHGARLYRSGDLARRLDCGDLVFGGRRDRQVKLRGFRIEMGEIETRLNDHQRIETAVVLLNETNGKQLVAYVKPESNPSPESHELRQYLGESLPEYMVPTTFAFVDHIPLTPTGKIDRRALALLEIDKPSADGYVAPRNEAEQQLAHILEAVLDAERVGIHDNFFELGGDSILAIQVLAKAEEADLKLSIQQLFMTPTIDGLAQSLTDREGAPALASPVSHTPFSQAPFALISDADREAIPAAVEDAYPITKLQEGMIYHSEISPDSPVYHDLFSYRVTTPFDENAWRSTLERLMERHALLRTGFYLMTYSRPLQLVYRSAELPLTIRDLRHVPSEEQERALADLVETETKTSFQWQQPPLLRLQLARLDEESFHLMLSFHHAILDGWSLASLFSELFGTYHALLRNEDPVEPELPTYSFGDYVALEQAALNSDEHRAFWTSRLMDFQLPPLPRTRVGKPQSQLMSGQWEADIEGDLYGDLHQLARDAGVPIKSVLLAAYLKMQAFASGTDTAATGLSSNCRLEHGGGDKMLGLFLNMVPLHLNLNSCSWQDFVIRVFEAERELIPWRRYPMAEIQRLNDQQPLFHSLFNYLNYHVLQKSDAFGDMRMEPGETVTETHMPLTLNLEENSGARQIHMSLAYAPEFISQDQAHRLGTWYLSCLQAMTADPQGDSFRFKPFSKREKEVLDESGNRTAKTGLSCQTLYERFSHWVSETPEADAVIHGEASLTYAELDARARQLAQHLLATGVRPGESVALCFDRCPDMLVALLAILRAGASYLPLDPTFPKDRLAFMMADAGVRRVITQPAAAESLPQSDALLIDLSQIEAQQLPEQPFPTAVPEQLAYTMYTSGSTGQPKGVQISHRNVMDLIMHADWIDFTPVVRTLQLASLGFDASTFEIWGALLTGGACVLLSDRVPDIRDIQTCIREYGTDTAFITASLFNSIINENPKALEGMRHILVGGEALSVRHLQKAAEHLPQVRFSNGYGPTETTVFACVHNIREELNEEVHTIPIGKPLPYSQALVVDKHGHPVPVGAMGELLIGGDGLTRGYLNQPSLTARILVPHPFSKTPGARLYRTGDQVRWLEDGTLEFIGRIDTQVKLRGFRIELDEISTHLSQLPGVVDAVTVMVRDEHGQHQLDAYLVPEPGTEPDVPTLRGQLAASLPKYMIPARFLLIDKIPLTANGKIDRRALAVVHRPAPGIETGFVEPRTSLEREIAAIWSSVLERDPVGIHDDFMALGGHSLMATLVVSRIRKDYGLEKFPLRLVFENPTVAELAVVVADHLEANKEVGDQVGNLLDFVMGLSDEEADAYMHSLTEDS